MTKPRSQAAINADAGTRAVRSLGRIPTLEAAIAKAKARKQTTRVKSLEAELKRRRAEVKELREALDDI